eukprot:IDg11317t1
MSDADYGGGVAIAMPGFDKVIVAFGRASTPCPQQKRVWFKLSSSLVGQSDDREYNNAKDKGVGIQSLRDRVLLNAAQQRRKAPSVHSKQISK